MARVWRWMLGALAAVAAVVGAVFGWRKHRAEQERNAELARTAAALALENARRARENADHVRAEAERRALEAVRAADTKAEESAGRLDDLGEYFRRLRDRGPSN